MKCSEKSKGKPLQSLISLCSVSPCRAHVAVVRLKNHRFLSGLGVYLWTGLLTELLTQPESSPGLVSDSIPSCDEEIPFRISSSAPKPPKHKGITGFPVRTHLLLVRPRLHNLPVDCTIDIPLVIDFMTDGNGTSHPPAASYRCFSAARQLSTQVPWVV